MAQRNQNSFAKKQKENLRRQKAQEKMARRQGKDKRDKEAEEIYSGQESKIEQG